MVSLGVVGQNSDPLPLLLPVFRLNRGSSAHKFCINAGIFNNGNKIGNNDTLLHHYWIGKEFGLANRQ